MREVRTLVAHASTPGWAITWKGRPEIKDGRILVFGRPAHVVLCARSQHSQAVNRGPICCGREAASDSPSSVPLDRRSLSAVRSKGMVR